ncbi:MAG: hypothetical protein M3271_07245 [Actinomycetota bacterium]|nr:hypothetical protein [Actinomycetota bacterium]
MSMRRTAAEGLLRLLLTIAALVVLRYAELEWQEWHEQVSSTFKFTRRGWLEWIALLVLTGFVVGLACLPGLPRGYRWIVPLAISVPALLLLGDYVLVFETAGAGGTDLPGILYRPTIYMTVTVQLALAVIAGIGLAAGLYPRQREAALRRAEEDGVGREPGDQARKDEPDH